jgi:hypothetical protein
VLDWVSGSSPLGGSLESAYLGGILGIREEPPAHPQKSLDTTHEVIRWIERDQ